MKIAITGSSGMVGQELIQTLNSKYSLVRVVRSEKPKSELPTVKWDIKNGTMESDKLEGVDAVINLAGASIADKRWSNDYKQVIRQSRVESTKLLCRTLTQLSNPPKVLLSASAVGYYGTHDPQEELDEYSLAGNDFLAHVCKEWEAATSEAEITGIRVVHMRFGTILSPKGGALKKMLPPFKMGAGGTLGDGKQMMSWVALKEIPHVVEFLLSQSGISGPVNVVAPQAVTNKEYTKTLGHVIHRPTILPMPAPAVKLLFGEMGETLLLKGQKVKPSRLLDENYEFQLPDLESALDQSI